jgi:hypothetical protein
MQAAFSLFDDSGDEDDAEPAPPPAPKHVAAMKRAPPPVQVPTADCMAAFEGSKRQRKLSCPLAIWSEAPPLYMGPCQYQDGMSDVGGARGFIAAHDISPGTLLCSEAPFVPWPEGKKHEVGESMPIAMARSILERPDAVFALKQLSLLHPIILATESPGVKAETLEQHKEEIEQLLIRCQQNPELAELNATQEVILRLLLVCRFNCFRSGLYLHLSIFNHSCFPNAIKFNTSSEMHPGLSEIRATRFIKRGEELTICYLVPREQSLVRAHAALERQFFFAPVDEPTAAEMKSYDLLQERVGDSGTADTCEDEGGSKGEGGAADAAALVEKLEGGSSDGGDGSDGSDGGAIARADAAVAALKKAVQDESSGDGAEVGQEGEAMVGQEGGGMCNRMAEGVHSSLADLLGLLPPVVGGQHQQHQQQHPSTIPIACSCVQINIRHVVLARAWRVVAEAAAILMKHPSAQGKPEGAVVGLSHAQLLLVFTGASWELLKSQDQYLGLHHPDRASTLQDLSSGIQGVLTMLSQQSPAAPTGAALPFSQQVAIAFPEWGGSFDAASHMENATRREFGRVRDLYPAAEDV